MKHLDEGSVATPRKRMRPRVAGENAAAQRADYELRFAVATKPGGRVELRYFSSPGDALGTTIRLTPLERELLAYALAVPGFHAIARDDAPDLQRRLSL